MADFLQGTDGEFDALVNNLVTYVNANLAGLGLVAGDVASVVAGLTAWTSAYTDHIAKQTAARSATEAKDAARTTLTNALRQLIALLRAKPQVDSTELLAMGLSVYDTIPTATTAPTTPPIGRVDTSQRLRHTIDFTDSTTPTTRRKPDGVQGCEIWMKVGGAPPTDASELSFLAMDTRAPYSLEFDGADAGKTVHYMLRWVNTRGDRGPWSETVSATITG